MQGWFCVWVASIDGEPRATADPSALLGMTKHNSSGEEAGLDDQAFGLRGIDFDT